jgi:GNAT superfamily N-acetyltransferase
MSRYELNPQELERFITALGEKPDHTVSIHQLRHNLAKVWLIGELEHFRAAVVQWTLLPEEPLAFGEDAGKIWEILQKLSGWDRIQVAATVARPLGQRMQTNLECPIHYQDNLYFLLDTPLTTIPPHDESVTLRFLTIADVEMVQNTSPHTYPIVLPTLEATLRHTVVVGAVVDKQLVGFAESREADKHVELGVYTDEKWRKRGLASGMAGMLVQHFQARGFKIVWATDADNLASRRVAQKLGFREVLRRVFVIPQQEA